MLCTYIAQGPFLNMPYYALIFLTTHFLNICSGMREIAVEFSTSRAPSQMITELMGIILDQSLKLKGKLLFFHGRGICWGVIM